MCLMYRPCTATLVLMTVRLFIYKHEFHSMVHLSFMLQTSKNSTVKPTTIHSNKTRQRQVKKDPSIDTDTPPFT